jgi:hypothetical protein
MSDEEEHVTVTAIRKTPIQLGVRAIIASSIATDQREPQMNITNNPPSSLYCEEGIGIASWLQRCSDPSLGEESLGE